MKKIALLIIACFNSLAFSQFEGIALEEEATMNIVKTNITGIFLRNYSIQAERVINKSFSFNQEK